MVVECMNGSEMHGRMNGNRYMEVNDTNDTDVNDKRKKSWYDKRCEKKDRKINHRETGEEI